MNEVKSRELLDLQNSHVHGNEQIKLSVTTAATEIHAGVDPLLLVTQWPSVNPLNSIRQSATAASQQNAEARPGANTPACSPFVQ